MLDKMNYQICSYYINKITNEKTNYSPPFLNFKNIQTRWGVTISLYSTPYYSPPLYSLYSPPSLNFQTDQ